MEQLVVQPCIVDMMLRHSKYLPSMMALYTPSGWKDGNSVFPAFMSLILWKKNVTPPWQNGSMCFVVSITKQKTVVRVSSGMRGQKPEKGVGRWEMRGSQYSLQTLTVIHYVTLLSVACRIGVMHPSLTIHEPWSISLSLPGQPMTSCPHLHCGSLMQWH